MKENEKKNEKKSKRVNNNEHGHENFNTSTVFYSFAKVFSTLSEKLGWRMETNS